MVLVTALGDSWAVAGPQQTADVASGSGLVVQDPGDGGQEIILRTTTPPEPKFLYATTAAANVTLKPDMISQQIDVEFRVIQGRPQTIRLGVNGPGTVVTVEGDNVQAWAVRTEGDQRFLDIEVKKDAVNPKATIQIQTKPTAGDLDFPLTHLAPGTSVGFDSRIHVQSAPGMSTRIVQVEGFIRLNQSDAGQTGDASGMSSKVGHFGLQTATGGKLVLRLSRNGGQVLPVEINDMTLDGLLDSASNSISFQLQGTAKVIQSGAKMRLVSGVIALSDLPTGGDYQVNLLIDGEQTFYELEFPKAGSFALDLKFVAALVSPSANWQGIQFSVTANAIVPVTLKGFDQDLQFQREGESLIPIWDGENWQGFLPASGIVNVGWRSVRKAGQGKLFFTTSAQVEAQVGPGLLRQDHDLDYQVLQGQLKSLGIEIQGPGEILDVEGDNIVGWKVSDKDGVRRLEIALGQPIAGQSQIRVRSQTPLDAFPVRVAGMVLKPLGAIRHSGHLRISNTGSVRLSPTDLNGLTQLGPELFPGQPLEARQLFVYRFPSADYAFTLIADRIQPEINVNELVVYALSPSERVITADMELDIREAGIREWRFAVPQDYSIVAVTGANVSDYIVATQAIDGRRDLKVIFNQDIEGRHLVSIRLEQSIPAAAGDWVLPRIAHPEAKAVRGDIGVVGAPGFRIAAGATDFLVEKPLSTFPNAVANLQQAFRIRQPDWTATMQVEPLDRSIQSDVFHLYSLSQGTVYGSVLVNYFVTGAPTSQWDLSVPAELGNVNVDGQNIRSWRRDGDTLSVTLHQPVIGPYTLLLTYEQKPGQVDGSFVVGQVAPIGVQGDRGYVQLVSPMQVEIDRLLVSSALLELDPLELPAELRLLSTAPALGTWQYTQRPFDLKLNVKWFEPGTTATQVVEFSEANSHVSSDGELVTDVVYFVKSRGQRTLRVKLPGDPVRLWAVSVNGQPVTARQADDITLIPLQGGVDPNVPMEVSLRLGKPAVAGKQTKVSLPRVYAPVLKTRWNVQGDENHVIVRTAGTVEASQPVVWPNGFDWLAKAGLLPLGVIALFVLLAAIASRNSSRSSMPILASLQESSKQRVANGDTVTGESVTGESVIDDGVTGESMPGVATGIEPVFESGAISGATRGTGRSGRQGLVVVICSAIAVLAAVFGAGWALTEVAPPAALQMNLPVLAAGENVMIEVQNVPSWQVHFSLLGLCLAVGGVLLGLVCRWTVLGILRRPLLLIALGLLGVGTLLQPNGAIWFFASVALVIVAIQLLPAVWQCFQAIAQTYRSFEQRRREQGRDEQGQAVESNSSTVETGRDDSSNSGGSAIVITGLVFAMIGLNSISGSTLWAAPTDGFQSASSLTQQWQVASTDARLTASGQVTMSGRPGDQFVLLRAPAVLSKFEGEGLRLTKRDINGSGLTYIVTIPFEEITEEVSDVSIDNKPPKPAVANDAALTIDIAKQYTATFEYRIEAVDVASGVPVYTGPAAMHKIDLVYDQPDWEASCSSAARIQLISDGDPDAKAERTHVQLLLRSQAAPIVLRPRTRDLSTEETQFFVEGSQLYIPGPGVVDGRHQLNIRTSQGKVSDLRVTVPEGLTVSAVAGPVSSWRFDADNRQLNLEIDSTAVADFSVRIETQRALDPLPVEVILAPLRVESAGGEVGLLAVAFGSDAQPETIESEGFSQVNIGDFDASLVANSKEVLQRVFRYGVDAGVISVRVIPVAAEVRVVSRQVLSLGDERIVLGANFSTEISRTGLFQLSFRLPEGMEVESLSGESLHHWSEIVEGENRRVILDLNGKTIGTQNFALVLAGAAPSNVEQWQVPHFALDQADRQSGELLIRPIPGIRLRATTRQNISELDPRSMGAQQQVGQGWLAFRLLQRDWNLVLGIEKLDPWVTAQVLHEVTLREGQTRSTLLAEVNIENASLRSLPITLQLDDAAVIKTVRATGAAVSDFVRTSPDSNTWELQFKRRVIGRVQFQIEFERRGDRASDSEWLTPIQFPQSRQLAYYFAVRTGGRLEIEPADLTQGWQRLDWNMVPPSLREAGNRTAGALTLRAMEPVAPLAVKVIRHSLAEALKLRVTEGTLTTVLSPNGDQLTAVDVTMEVIQRSSLAVQLPPGGQLFSIFVNGESVHSIRQSDNPNGWQFYILPGIDDRTAKVRFVYLASGDDLSNMKLVSPELNVPLENVTWNVIAPPGYELTDSDGNLELLGKVNQENYDRKSYLSKISGKRKDQAEQAAQLLQQAGELLQAGEQSKARWALNNVANRYALDAASNEDARVQLQNLQTQHAIVGLNTRRQRFFLDNKRSEASAEDNEQFRQAAVANPILQQDQMKFRPQELSQLLAGNTSEDNAVLQQIAGRLVQHQRTTEPAPQAIVISLPEEGTIYRFSRGVQVAQNAPLELDLQFHSRYKLQLWQWAVVGSVLILTAFGLTYSWQAKRA